MRHLRYFQAVADEGGISPAARRLRVAQPVLSRQLRDLEAELSRELLTRGARGIELTAGGEAFRRGAAAILAELDAAVSRAREAAGSVEGRIRIGVGRALQWLLSERLTAVLAMQFPDLSVELTEIESGPNALDSLRAGAVDVLLVIEPDKAQRTDLVVERVLNSPVCLALLPPSHPLAGRASLRVAELSDTRLLTILPSFNPSLHREVLRALREAGNRSVIEDEHAGPFSIWTQVAAGRGWAPMPDILHHHLPANTVAVTLEDLAVPMWAAVIRRRDDTRPSVLPVFDAIAALSRESASPPKRRPPSRRRPADVEAGNPSAIDLRHLRAVAALQSAGSVGRGAAELGLSQPALSKQLAELERIVGVRLLDRRARNVTLTAAGLAVHAGAVRILDLLAGLSAAVAPPAPAAPSRCVIGIVGTVSAGAMASALVQRCADAQPGLTIAVEDVPSPLQPDALLAGRMDIGLAHLQISAVGTAIAREVLVDDPLQTALIAKGHPLAARAMVSAADLEDVPFLFMRRDFQPQFFDRVMLECERIGFRPRLTSTFDGLQTVWRHAAAGRGWALGFASHLAHPPTGLVAREIRGFRIPSGLMLIWRRDEHRAPILAALDTLRSLATPAGA